MENHQEYDLFEHRHRFYAWAAATAASRSPKCRFTVKMGVELIEMKLHNGVSLKEIAGSVNKLPEIHEFDDVHRRWREYLCDKAPSVITSSNSKFTHGVAAKLINCYLKGVFTCGGHFPCDRVRVMHPPIDRLLLNDLMKPLDKKYSEITRTKIIEKKNVWKKYRNRGWSNFCSIEYEDVISNIKDVYDGEMWKVEEYWSGAQ